jgi:hypothetical protein
MSGIRILRRKVGAARWSLVVAIFMLAWKPAARGEELTPERLSKLAAFSSHGIDFGTTRPRFLELCPDAKPVRAIEGADVGVFAFDMPGAKGCDAVRFAFFGDELLEIDFVYGA